MNPPTALHPKVTKADFSRTQKKSPQVSPDVRRDDRDALRSGPALVPALHSIRTQRIHLSEPSTASWHARSANSDHASTSGSLQRRRWPDDAFLLFPPAGGIHVRIHVRRRARWHLRLCQRPWIEPLLLPEIAHGKVQPHSSRWDRPGWSGKHADQHRGVPHQRHQHSGRPKPRNDPSGCGPNPNGSGSILGTAAAAAAAGVANAGGGHLDRPVTHLEPHQKGDRSKAARPHLPSRDPKPAITQTSAGGCPDGGGSQPALPGAGGEGGGEEEGA